MKWNEWKKQNNRLETLKFSIIDEISKLTGNNEIVFRESVLFNNSISDVRVLVKGLNNEYALVESMGKSQKIELFKINADTLIDALRQLEIDSMLNAFGYPECCIQHFSDNQSESHDVNWNGFIPCTKHKDLTLEEITKLLGRNPVTEDKTSEWFLEGLSSSTEEEVYEEYFKSLYLSVEDNNDGTYTGYCNPYDEEEGIDGAIFTYPCFSKQEAIKKIKEFADNYKNI